MTRKINLSAGPAAMPLEVLEEIQSQWLDFKGSGMSIVEMSHRSPEYDAVHEGTKSLFKELLSIGDDFEVLFFGGGATTQFSMIPMNFLTEGESADYILTGAWSKKAVSEGKKATKGTINIASDLVSDGKYTRIPSLEECQLDSKAKYVHVTSNNTIFGTQWHNYPKFNKPVVADMSSDIMSRPIDMNGFDFIYAGAQKNLGPSGVTIVIARKSFLEQATVDGLPAMLNYGVQAEKGSLFNTPPCFQIYAVGCTLNWIKQKGGLQAMADMNQAKADRIYQSIENADGFYRCPVDRNSRSQMNIVFRLPSDDQEKQFIEEAKAEGIVGIKGHRSVGGIRLSTYNATSLEAANTIADFMDAFKSKNS